jgi:hypothetical protein
LIAGVVLLAWTPISFLYVASIEYSASSTKGLGTKDGAIWLFDGPSVFWQTGWEWRFEGNTEFQSRALLPFYERDPVVGGRLLVIPLWLLAFLCLAWPVTSFILARRKPKRGFPIEPKTGGEAVSPPLSTS